MKTMKINTETHVRVILTHTDNVRVILDTLTKLE